MTTATYMRNLAIFMSFLIVMLPVAFADTINLFYDANGNVIQENINGNPHLKREYNGLNQLVAVRNATNDNYIEKYTHHPLQERIWIKEVYNSSGSLKETVYYLSKEFVRTVNASSGQVKDYTYVWMDGQLVAQVNPDNTTYYILGDHLGSTNIVTNSSGAVIENTSYNPDGGIIEGGTASRYGYEAKEHNSILGDIDFNFRKYSAEYRIFLQPDTLLQNIFDPQLLNRYSFERNNPWKNKDESGHALFNPGAEGSPADFIDFISIILALEISREETKKEATQDSTEEGSGPIPNTIDVDKSKYTPKASINAMESAKTPIKETTYTTKRPEDYKAPEPNKEIEGITSKKIGEEKQKDLIKNINAQTQKQTGWGGGSTTSYGGGGSGSSGGIQDYRQSSWNKIVEKLKSIWKSKSSSKGSSSKGKK